jgi:hypothetical protein
MGRTAFFFFFLGVQNFVHIQKLKMKKEEEREYSVAISFLFN